MKITLHQADGTTKVLKETLALQQGEVIDATKLSIKALNEFFEKEIQDCFDKGNTKTTAEVDSLKSLGSLNR